MVLGLGLLEANFARRHVAGSEPMPTGGSQSNPIISLGYLQNQECQLSLESLIDLLFDQSVTESQNRTETLHAPHIQSYIVANGIETVNQSPYPPESTPMYLLMVRSRENPRFQKHKHTYCYHSKDPQANHLFLFPRTIYRSSG
jgi:hypothetical protein